MPPSVQQKITISVPSVLNSDQRIEVGKLIIKKIKERTSRGLDVNDSKFTAYSDAYKKSKDFKNAGKSSLVNLKLSGEMLGDLDILGHNQGFITIGYAAGSEESDKAQWAAAFDNGPRRLFLGISTKDLDNIINQVGTESVERNVRQLIEGGTINFRGLLGLE